ncbi:centromere protein W-like [Branchiostoma floridae]|uniref:Centromere protein W-like n=1 Tax=Branchiostoma floridae TaxID=7739 RepID=A0A9J7MHZ1_BRAFL|nr:centromere protein W-like [Branchiostoma floridae]
MKRSCPRARVRAVVKRYQTNAKLSKNAELVVFLSYMLFLKRLAAASCVEAQQDRQKTVTGQHVKKVLKNVLKASKG